jgi:hypothetical protein
MVLLARMRRRTWDKDRGRTISPEDHSLQTWITRGYRHMVTPKHLHILVYRLSTGSAISNFLNTDGPYVEATA